jgi:hypothetical protein
MYKKSIDTAAQDVQVGDILANGWDVTEVNISATEVEIVSRTPDANEPQIVRLAPGTIVIVIQYSEED